MEFPRVFETGEYYEINYPNKVLYKEAYKSWSSSQSAHKIESRYFTGEIAQLVAAVIGFNKKLHTRPGQKVNYLNALSGRFDKVSHERDLSLASYYGAETNADVQAVKHSLVRKIFRFGVARLQVA